MSEVLDKIDSSLPHYEVRCFLATAQPGPEADATFARLLRLPTGKPYSSDLNAAADALDHLGWWWHQSHLEASVTPTSALGDLPVSNSQHYDREGHPITYRAMALGRNKALTLMTAVTKAAFDLPDAFYVRASHIDEVLAKPVWSRRRMMAYYSAMEDRRQKALSRWAATQKA